MEVRGGVGSGREGGLNEEKMGRSASMQNFQRLQSSRGPRSTEMGGLTSFVE